jgi:predicted nucleotidyltransferase
MSAPTPATLRLRSALAEKGDEVAEILSKYGATNARLFGSVARGEARADSDVDLIVDLDPGEGNELLRVAGVSEELSVLLGVKVDVFPERACFVKRYLPPPYPMRWPCESVKALSDELKITMPKFRGPRSGAGRPTS